MSNASSDDDLDSMLAGMDIDNDFDIWSSFRHRTKEGGADDSNKKLSEMENLEQSERSKWRNRLGRTEVYSHRYHASDAEKKEILELEKFLGLSGNFLTTFLGGIAGSPVTAPDANKREAWDRLAHSEKFEGQPQSVILKRGPILLDGKQESELILMTHGLVIASVPAKSADSSSADNAGNKKDRLVLRQFDHAILWNQVVKAVPSGGGSKNWELQLQNDKTLVFACSTHAGQQAWLEALQLVVVKSWMHSGKAPSHLCWQYQLVEYPPLFVMAVTGKNIPEDLAAEQYTKEELNALDEYHGYAPLHYAVRYGHLAAVQALLQAGAEHSLKDSQDHHTPMYYAQLDDQPRAIIQALQKAGAKKENVQPSGDPKSLLFGKVAETQQLVNERREAEQERKAEAAKVQMTDNMKALQERGQKIEEIGEKASDLNDNAKNFADMAKELREKTEQQSKWMPF